MTLPSKAKMPMNALCVVSLENGSASIEKKEE